MSLDALPDEMVVKIMEYLADDSKSFISLASTCRRFHNLLDTFVYKPIWKEMRPITFNFYLDDGCLYSNSTNDAPQETECDCTHEPAVIRVKPYRKSECYYKRIGCWLDSHRRRFSTLRFKSSYVYNAHCLRNAFEMASHKERKLQAETNIKYLVSLELGDCTTTVEWLNALLIALPSVCYLKLYQVAYKFPVPAHDKSNDGSDASRGLIRLQMNGSIPSRFFNYLLTKFPALELDLNGLSVLSKDSNIQWQRQSQYMRVRDVLIPGRARVSKLSILAVLPYLLKQQMTVQHLIVSHTDITTPGLLRILEDERLQHLKITAKCCPKITSEDRVSLANQLSASVRARLAL